MAYPVRQFPQPSPDPSIRYTNAANRSRIQHNSNEYAYQDGAPNSQVYDHPSQDLALSPNGSCSRTRNIGPNQSNAQWPEYNTAWASHSHQPYISLPENGRVEQPQLLHHHDASYDQGIRQYGARRSPPNHIHYQRQPSERDDPSPHPPRQQQQYLPPRGDHPTVGQPTGFHDSSGVFPRANIPDGPAGAQMGAMNGLGKEQEAAAGRRLQDPTTQQVQTWTAQDGRVEQPGHAPRHGISRPEVPKQSHKANPAIGSSKRPVTDRILTGPVSPETTIGWDNPFPTFPKKRGKHNREEDLNQSMADMSFNQGPHTEQLRTLRSAAAEGQETHDSSRYDGNPNLREGASTLAGPRRIQGPSPISPANNGNMQSVLGPNQIPVSQPNRSWNHFQPQKDSGRRSEDTARDRTHRPPVTYHASDQRSQTMPASVTDALGNSDPRQAYEQNSGVRGDRYHPASYDERGNSERPLPSLPARPPMHPHSQSVGGAMNTIHSTQEPWTHYSASHHHQQASLGEVFDSYYHSPYHSNSSSTQGNGGQPTAFSEHSTLSFGAVSQAGAGAGHNEGMGISDYSNSHQPASTLSPMPSNTPIDMPTDLQMGSRLAEEFPRSGSSPILQQQSTQGSQQYSDGFNFELPGSVPAMYSSSPQPPDNHHSNVHDGIHYQSRTDRWRQRPGANGPQIPVGRQEPSIRPSVGDLSERLPQSRSPDSRNRPPLPGRFPREISNGELRKRSSPTHGGNPRSPPIAPQHNPDALPAHPAPVRAGLMHSPPSNPSPRPPPVRQYTDGASPLHESSSRQRPQISRAPREETKPAAVTYGELERLRQASRSNPPDSKTQLLLAKKLAEAASVLADEAGRADPRTSSRNREKFTAEAYKIVKKLAQLGYPDAMFYLGDCHSRGLLGLQTDAKEAFGCYQSAAKTGHAQAAYRVAVCCEMGLDEGGGTKRDAVKAMQWYQRAATLGDTPAMYKLGVLQLKGLLGQPRDAKAALTWLRRAAERADKENPHALHELALLYEAPSGFEGVAHDEAHAKQLFIEAANLGYKFSQFRLGCAFEYGLLGCPIDPRQSIAWYSKAAVQDEHQSELALSGWYLTGSEGVLSQSDTEAYLWARKAAQAGLSKAEYAMGYFTEVGIGAPANIEDAKRWYWRSASQNFPRARERLEDLRRGGAKMQKTRVSRSKMNKQSEGECIVM
ncbi:MAG: hypothetical protein Q9170_001643 [Blastenia crenularia]